MTPEALEQFKAHAIAEYPREACGVVCVIKGRERYIPCRNMAGSPTEQFSLHPEDYANAEERGEVVGIAHSHPNASARPSDADRVGCEASELPWHILSVGIDAEGKPAAHDEPVTIRPCGYQAPLVGRQFVFGVLDCYTLVRDYYRREHGILLPDFEREDEFWLKGQSLYVDNFRSAGFEIAQGEVRPGDAFLMQIRSPLPNHAAIYLGNGVILHHLYGRLSSRDVYGGYWQEVTTHTLRHKDLA